MAVVFLLQVSNEKSLPGYKFAGRVSREKLLYKYFYAQSSGCFAGDRCKSKLARYDCSGAINGYQVYEE